MNRTIWINPFVLLCFVLFSSFVDHRLWWQCTIDCVVNTIPKHTRNYTTFSGVATQLSRPVSVIRALWWRAELWLFNGSIRWSFVQTKFKQKTPIDSKSRSTGEKIRKLGQSNEITHEINQSGWQKTTTSPGIDRLFECLNDWKFCHFYFTHRT